jgi:hypothetical protein
MEAIVMSLGLGALPVLIFAGQDKGRVRESRCVYLCNIADPSVLRTREDSVSIRTNITVKKRIRSGGIPQW